MVADETTTAAIAASTGVIGALRAGGMLRLQEEPPSPPPPPRPPTAPQPKVGDIANLDSVIAVAKTIQTIPSDRTQFILRELRVTYELEFPPNDPGYIPELDRLLTVSFTGTRHVSVFAQVEITEVHEDVLDRFGAKLGYLYVYGQI
jgi:hypothetical protein